MRLFVNPNAGSVTETLLQALRLRPDVDVVDVDSPEATCEAAAEAAREGVPLVVAAGGDGTVHAVANGLMRTGDRADERPVLGVLPLGTGNDLARTLGFPLDQGIGLLDAFDGAPHCLLDLICVTDPAGSRYAVNACAGGFTGQMNEIMTEEMKDTWGPLAYLLGAAQVLPDLSTYHTTITWEDGTPERIDAFNVVVANARTAGGGHPVAPRANPTDGLLDVVVVRTGSVLDLARLAARMFTGDYLSDDQIVHRRVRRVRIDSTPGMWFNVDGELHTQEPVAFAVEPGALRVLVGPEFVAEP